MPDVTSANKSEISKAVCELRTRLGDSQQAFSNRLGLALNTIARYETSREPSGDVLLMLADLAEKNGHLQLSSFFRTHYLAQVSPKVQSRLLTVPGTQSEPPHGFLTWDPKGVKELRYAQACNFAFGLARSTVPDTIRKIDEAFAALEAVVIECAGNPIVQAMQDALKVSTSGSLPERPGSKKPKPSPRKKDAK
jgi:transcriptional regulator with XRE-family HTH domain